METQEQAEVSFIVVLLNTDKIRIRLLGKGVNEEACLANAYARAVQMYPLQAEWEFLFWEPYE